MQASYRTGALNADNRTLELILILTTNSLSLRKFYPIFSNKYRDSKQKLGMGAVIVFVLPFYE